LVNSDGSITAVSPLGAAGTVDVTVVTAYGTSATGSADHFTYSSGSTTTPTVDSLSEDTGPATGGTEVTITGDHPAGATQVLFGDLPAASFRLQSDGSILAVAPAQRPDTLDVRVVTPLGISSASSGDEFTYEAAAPTLSAVSPSSATTAGGAL